MEIYIVRQNYQLFERRVSCLDILNTLPNKRGDNK